MDTKKYDVLRNKIKSKDFEGKNKTLDRWLFKTSFVGNIGSIFFAYFLLYPALYRSITNNLLEGILATILSNLFTLIVLVAFESIKRMVLSNYSFDLVKDKLKLKLSTIGWFLSSILLIVSSFYFSLTGAKKFASTSTELNIMVDNSTQSEIDSLTLVFNKKIEKLEIDTDGLRNSNTELREKLINTPANYSTTRKNYQIIIDNNLVVVEKNKSEIFEFQSKLLTTIQALEGEKENKQEENANNDLSNIILFLFVSAFIELIIIGGVYFRQYYDYNVYLIHELANEKIYKKRERYKALLQFIYKEGSLNIGEQVIGSVKLKELVKDNSRVTNSNKLVDNFFREMENIGVIKNTGRRRYINMGYDEALDSVENLDDSMRLLETLV